MEEQAILLGIQAACIYCQKKKWELTHIETSNIEVYETIRLQEHIVLNADQLEAYGLFNTVQANHYKPGITHRKLSCIPQHMNATAKYMAEYGLRHMTCFAEAPGIFGDLKYYLERDMGLVLPSPIHELVPNFGEGEVEDASPPPLKRKRESIVLPFPDVLVNSPLLKARCFGFEGKGKEKMYKEFAFYDDGRLSARAMEIINSGCLDKIAPVFAEEVIDLESHVGNGFFAKDVLHYAVLGTLEIVLPLIQNTFPAVTPTVVVKEPEFMPVNEVLSSMGFLNEQEDRAIGSLGMSSKKAPGV
ncbi:hypothetical protein DCAR_0728645 [Daucus carota subsp. sativus]|uniref:Uncharacterized protein n=2 Tax=Daucus carota subsp. sativus TaxID=79200 RepID=A0AAF0XJZ8_DAUCS|nr:hypothetical protein DCAR_0728645 [Daucus carota subsp. sativus]